jgi:DNA-binding response OmpR family regulator
MARILSISYNPSLLRTRQLVLESRGYKVTSALGFTEAVRHCKTGHHDLVIIGHSIPISDKQQMIKELRNVSATPVLALMKPNEEPLNTADYNLDYLNTEKFVEFINEVLDPKA